MNVGSKTNLSPLTHVDTRLHGYFIDVDGAVWSNPGTSEPRKLTVRNGFVQLTYRGSQRLFSVNDLLWRARAQTTWKTETGAVKSVPEVKSAVKPTGWIIGTLTAEGSFTFAATPKVQSTEACVKSELERLAKAHPGVTFVSFKIEKSATAGGVVWG